MTKIAFIGSGVLAQHIAHYVKANPAFEIAGFYDDFRQPGENTPNGPVLGAITQVQSDFDARVFDQLLIGIGYNHLALRKSLFEQFSAKIPFASYLHPSCVLDPSCRIGAGVVALPGCVFDMNVSVEANSFFNIGCAVAHDSVVGAHSFFGPAVKLAGFVEIGQTCFMGVGTTVINNLKICDGTQTGGGAVVTRSIETPGLYAGVPAKLLTRK